MTRQKEQEDEAEEQERDRKGELNDSQDSRQWGELTPDIPCLPLGNVNQKQHAHQYSSKDDIYFQSHMYNNKFCIMTKSSPMVMNKTA